MRFIIDLIAAVSILAGGGTLAKTVLLTKLQKEVALKVQKGQRPLGDLSKALTKAKRQKMQRLKY